RHHRALGRRAEYRLPGPVPEEMSRAVNAIVAALAGLLVLAGMAATAQAQIVRAQTASPFANWAAIVVAGDWRAHDGGPSEGFDNARRDISKALIQAGFSKANIVQFSTHPANYPDTRPLKTEFGAVNAELARLAGQAADGCLVYFTSHGSGMGILFGDDVLTPAGMARMVGGACGTRPTVVVISACFSGVFVPTIAAPNRMVLTAARADRSSFGCGQNDKYPYFDACMLESLPGATDFLALGRRAQACVANREKAEGLSPASEPQLAVGGAMRPVLPLYAFAERCTLPASQANMACGPATAASAPGR
ncbi:MAG: C13 family peptidase, partial [Caulobacteraceae bacterium]